MSERLENHHAGSTEFDIMIVGGGMVGSALACALDGHGMKIALLDAGSSPTDSVPVTTGFDPRVCALTEASRQLFVHLGVWKDMVADRVCPYKRMHVWDGEGTGNIQFGAAEMHLSSLGHIVENNVIQGALNKRLSASDVSCLYDSKVESIEPGFVTQVSLTDGRVYKAKLVVGADGAESKMRQLAGIPLNRRDCLHHAVVTTIETERYHDDTAWQRFSNTGPLAFLPLPDQNGKHRCSVVWSQVPEETTRIMQLDDAEFCRQLTRASEGCLGKVVAATERFSYPLRHRHARRYYSDSVVLVGDAAHTIHPLAGQGVNLGLLDVAVLAEELIHAFERGANIAGASVLSRYQRRRMGDNLAMLGAMEGFQHLFGADALPVRWLRNAGLKLTNRLPEVKHKLIRHAMGLEGDLPRLCREQTESPAA